MLIDKGISAGEVITLKLTSGEELIARLSEETPTAYKLTKPMVIGMGQKGPGLMPYLFTVSPDKEIPLLKTAVAMVVQSDKSFADQYLQSTTNLVI